MPRKTVNGRPLLARVNFFLANENVTSLDGMTPQEAARSTAATILEGILMDSGNYKGFQYLGSEYLPSAEQELGKSPLKPIYDDTRRRYIKAPGLLS